MKWITPWMLAGGIVTLAVAGEPAPAPGLTAGQIVEKNMAARGGPEAWRQVETMVWIGHIEGANPSAPGLPFVLQQKRPDKSRFEIQSQGQVSLRIYDGGHGWKLRAGGNSLPYVEEYNSEELRFARDWQTFDGPLMEPAAKGVTVALEGVDTIEGRAAYRLQVTLPSGERHHVWIDTRTFLDVKSDRAVHHAYGPAGRVSVFYRDYRSYGGLQIPMTIESGNDAIPTRDKMVIDKVQLNPPLADSLFARPEGVGVARPQVARHSSGPAARPQLFTPAPAMPGIGAIR